MTTVAEGGIHTESMEPCESFQCNKIPGFDH